MVMDFFAHRVHDVRFANGIVRIEFCMAGRDQEGEFSPDAPTKPEDVRFAVNLPLQGFGRSMGMMREFAQELQKKGVLRRQGEGEGGEDRPGQMRKKQASLVDITADDDSEGGDDGGQGGQPIV